jgi:hypothetical protein
VTILASQVQVTPNRLVSDGRLLFWTTSKTPGLLAMPVGGGAITILLNGPITNSYGGDFGATLLAVDEVNVYVLENNGLVRIPKDGHPATLINEGGAVVIDATTLGTTAYWVEDTAGGDTSPKNVFPVRSAPLLGDTVTLISAFTYPGAYMTNQIGVTSSTVFVGSVILPSGSQLFDFPLSTGVPAGGVKGVASGAGCLFITSDTDAVYCGESSGSNLRVASDGTNTALGAADSSSYVVFDDTYVYWADATTVGTIMKAPKAGGGTATVLANDPSPTAIAVDAHSVYWADQGGYIKSIAR